ncbi:putative ribonuclease H-like domain-containing protein [Tanacetum coccineum]
METRAIGSKWGFRNKKDEKGIVIRNKARLVAQGIQYKKKYKGDILLVQVYVDDIIFGSTKKELCNAFEKLMHEKFQMSSMGELTFFLGLQVKQKKDGLFISQDKYVEEIWSIIGSLMYLTSSRPDIMFAVCACARYQVNLKCKKQIVVANSTTEAEYVAASSCCGQVLWIQNQLLDNNKLLQIKEMADQDTPPPTITAMKIPIIKKGEYDIWSMRMRQYICHTYHNLWDIIVNGDLEDEANPSEKQSRPHEDINQKFLRSLPPSWSQIALIMRNKPDIDEIDIDDLYNNLRVYEDIMKKSSTSSSNTQDLAFLSYENTNSTNFISTASGDFGVSTAGGINQVPSTLSAHDIAYPYCTTNNQSVFLTVSSNIRMRIFNRLNGDDLEELESSMSSQRLSATTVTEKGILLENVDLEGVKKILMVTMAGAMHKQLNLDLSTSAQDVSEEAKTRA